MFGKPNKYLSKNNKYLLLNKNFDFGLKNIRTGPASVHLNNILPFSYVKRISGSAFIAYRHITV